VLLAALAPAGRRGGCRRGRWRWAPRRRRRREPAPGGEARARRRRSTRSKSGSKCVALRRDLPSRAGLPIRPVRSGGAHHTPRCIIDPPRGTHHPPRPQRAPAGRAPGELPAGVGRPGELILRVAGGEGGGGGCSGLPGATERRPRVPERRLERVREHQLAEALQAPKGSMREPRGGARLASGARARAGWHRGWWVVAPASARGTTRSRVVPESPSKSGRVGQRRARVGQKNARVGHKSGASRA
jgi:hypothetical protein